MLTPRSPSAPPARGDTSFLALLLPGFVTVSWLAPLLSHPLSNKFPILNPLCLKCPVWFCFCGDPVYPPKFISYPYPLTRVQTPQRPLCSQTSASFSPQALCIRFPSARSAVALAFSVTGTFSCLQLQLKCYLLRGLDPSCPH